MTKPLLSICIPTYNRAHYLKDCLESVVCQFDDEEVYRQVEIVISDNASEDNTEELVKEYQRRFKNINYFKNKENIGFDLNVVNSVEKASGMYCWYMGDDDAICNGGIKFMLDFLKGNKIAVLTVDTTIFTSLEEVIKKNIALHSRLFRSFLSYGEFFKEGNCAGILSVFIFNRDLWLENVDKTGYASGWLYYEVILKMISITDLKLVYCDYPIVYTKQDCDWVVNGAELNAFLNCKRLADKLTKFGYKKEIVRSAFNISPQRLCVVLLRAKGHDLECSIKNLFSIVHEFRSWLVYFPVISLVYFIPNPIIKFLRGVNKRYLKIKI
ncbi:MAG: glycosyl transferase family protein [uncultured bacterium]|nr:MAG: glycosyl transferase family protein [uncultured bacterium]